MMNSGDIVTHEGIVREAYQDMTLDILVPALAGGAVIEDVAPESVSPVRWRPRVGDRVRVLQRAHPLRPDLSLTWTGWSYERLSDDDESTHLIPTWMEAGQVHLLSEDDLVHIVLIDESTSTKTIAAAAGGTADASAPFLLLGSKDATEQAVCGNLWLEKARSVITEVRDVVAELQKVADALKTAVWPVAGGGGGTASPNAADALVFTDVSLKCSAIDGDLQALHDSAYEALSKYVFLSQEPSEDIPE